MPEQARAVPLRSELPLGNDPVSVRRRIEAIERLLERSFHVPGTKLPVGLDSIIGLVPLAGDVFDFLFLSNTRNIRIIRKHLDKHHPQSSIIEA